MIDAGGIAREVGSPRSTNVVLVGALSTALPFAVEEWQDAIRRRVPPKTVEANLEAFARGREATYICVRGVFYHGNAPRFMWGTFGLISVGEWLWQKNGRMRWRLKPRTRSH